MNTKNLPEKEVQCKHGAKHYRVDLNHFLLPNPISTRSNANLYLANRDSTVLLPLCL